MSNLNQLERSIRILQRLMTHDAVSVSELYDVFDRRESRRTLQRTLQSIEAANVPLRIRRGAHGEQFYSLDGALKFVPMTLSPDELLAALVLNQFADYFDGTSVGHSIRGVFAKMEQLLPPHGLMISSAFHDAQDALAIHDPGRARLEPKGQVVMDLLRAIITRTVCRVTYRGKSYPVEPYTLLLHAGSLYAIVYQPYHRNWIYLAVPRIDRLELQDERFQRKDSFHVAEFLRNCFGIWSAKPQKVRIRFARLIRPSIEGRSWHQTQTIREFKNGDIELAMTVGLTEELTAWILRWGPYAVVKSPKPLRENVKQKLKACLKGYR